MARDLRERNSAFMLCCGGEWATVHSRAGQTHLSPGRNLVRLGFPDVSGLGASFPPDSSEPSVITPRMTLWPAPTQTEEGRSEQWLKLLWWALARKKAEFAL